MVWFGLVWFWPGDLLSQMVWFGLVSDLVISSLRWFGLVWFDSDLVISFLRWFGFVWFGLVSNLVISSLRWFGLVWFGLILTWWSPPSDGLGRLSRTWWQTKIGPTGILRQQTLEMIFTKWSSIYNFFSNINIYLASSFFQTKTVIKPKRSDYDEQNTCR